MPVPSTATVQDCHPTIAGYFTTALVVDCGLCVGVVQLLTQMELRTHSFLRFPAHVWLKWLRRFESDIPTYSTVFRSLWCESKLERVIVAGCGKVFLESLAYAILMSFVFSLLHVETIGGCTALWCFKEQRCLCPLNERFKFLATTLEGWNLMAVIVPVY